MKKNSYNLKSIKEKAVRHSFYKSMLAIANAPDKYFEKRHKRQYTLRGFCHLALFTSDEQINIYHEESFPDTLPELYLFRPNEPTDAPCSIWSWKGCYWSDENWEVRKTILEFCILMTQ